MIREYPLLLGLLVLTAGCMQRQTRVERPISWTRAAFFRNGTYSISSLVDATLQSPEQRVGPIRIHLRITTYEAKPIFWTLHLVDDDGREVPSLDIVKQADGFVASFPRVATRAVRLRMSTARGSLDFNWSTH